MDIRVVWRNHVGHGADCLICGWGDRSTRDFEDRASLDAYREQSVVIRHTLEGGFRIMNN